MQVGCFELYNNVAACIKFNKANFSDSVHCPPENEKGRLKGKNPFDLTFVSSFFVIVKGD